MNVLRPVVGAMKEHEEWDDFSDQFKLKVQLLIGGTAEMKIGNCDWDFCAGMDNVNKMVKRIGPAFISVLKACITGLRSSIAAGRGVSGGLEHCIFSSS